MWAKCHGYQKVHCPGRKTPWQQGLSGTFTATVDRHNNLLLPYYTTKVF